MRQLPIYNEFSQIFSQAEVVDVAVKEDLFSPHNVPCEVFFVIDGCFKITQIENNKEVIVRLAACGDMLGHRSLFQVESYRARATALVKSQVLRLSREKFMDSIFSNPRLAKLFCEKLVHDIEQAEAQVRAFQSYNVRQRLAKTLLNFQHSFGRRLEGGTQRIELKLTRKDLASMVSAAMENTVRHLSDLKKENLVREENGFIEILDVKGLQKHI